MIFYLLIWGDKECFVKLKQCFFEVDIDGWYMQNTLALKSVKEHIVKSLGRKKCVFCLVVNEFIYITKEIIVWGSKKGHLEWHVSIVKIGGRWEYTWNESICRLSILWSQVASLDKIAHWPDLEQLPHIIVRWRG